LSEESMINFDLFVMSMDSVICRQKIIL